MTDTAIAVFVKTPGLSPVKTRLAAAIGQENAETFYHKSLAAVQHTLQQSSCSVYWAVGERKGLMSPLWQAFTAMHTGDGHLGHRQQHIYDSLLRRHRKVLLIGADTPQLTPAHLIQASEALENAGFVIGRACDGGYYLFGGKSPLPASLWNSVPWSSPHTCDILVQHLPSVPAPLAPLTDVDTVQDMEAMLAEMPAAMTAAQHELAEWARRCLESYQQSEGL